MAGSTIIGKAIAVAVGAALGVASPAITGTTGVAMAQGQMSQMPQVALTKPIVEAFIKSYPTVKQTADAVSKKYNIRTQGAEASGWGAWLSANSAWGEMNAVVKSFGFADFQAWLNTTINVAMAYAFAKDGGQMDTQMATAMQQIQNNPQLSAAQKQMMMQQMQASLGAMSAMRPPQANIDAVQPYAAQLAPLFGKN